MKPFECGLFDSLDAVDKGPARGSNGEDGEIDGEKVS